MKANKYLAKLEYGCCANTITIEIRPETEQLLGGLADGAVVLKTKELYVYAGWAGNGKVEVYLRLADGRLRWWRTFNVRVGEIVPTPAECRRASRAARAAAAK